MTKIVIYKCFKKFDKNRKRMENYIQICTIVIKVMTTNFLLIVHYVMKNM